jgi:hypothetical protein
MCGRGRAAGGSGSGGRACGAARRHAAPLLLRSGKPANRRRMNACAARRAPPPTGPPVSACLRRRPSLQCSSTQQRRCGGRRRRCTARERARGPYRERRPSRGMAGARARARSPLEAWRARAPRSPASESKTGQAACVERAPQRTRRARARCSSSALAAARPAAHGFTFNPLYSSRCPRRPAPSSLMVSGRVQRDGGRGAARGPPEPPGGWRHASSTRHAR